MVKQRVAIGNLNINSLPNKFNQMKELVLKHVDILVVTETKLDDSFQIQSFQLMDSLNHLELKEIDLEVGQ